MGFLGRLALSLLLMLPAVTAANAQIRDLAGVRYAVRGLLAEPTTTYLPDSLLNKFVNVAHRETMLALGSATVISLDTIVTTARVTRYTLNTDCSSIYTVVFKKLTGEERSLAPISPEQMGKIGQDQSPNYYFNPGQYVILGQSPEGGESLFVYYNPVAVNLTADTSSLQNDDDDDQAVVWLAAMMVLERDKQLEEAQAMRQLWEAHVRMKLPAPAPAPGAP